MFNRHALAGPAGFHLLMGVERRVEALLAEHGAADPSELPHALHGELLRRAIVEAAAANAPTADPNMLDHATRSLTHPLFAPAWGRVKSLMAASGDAFAMASGVDAAVTLAGFGLSVAPFDFNLGILEKPSDDIDTVLAMFSRWPSGLVGYSSCDAPFYVLLTNCIRSLLKQVSSHPGLFDVRRLIARKGSLPADPGRDFTPGMALFARQPGDAISTALLLDPSPSAGSLMLHAGWRVGDQAYGAPFDGYLPFPMPLLCTIADDPGTISWLCPAIRH